MTWLSNPSMTSTQVFSKSMKKTWSGNLHSPHCSKAVRTYHNVRIQSRTSCEMQASVSNHQMMVLLWGSLRKQLLDLLLIAKLSLPASQNAINFMMLALCLNLLQSMPWWKLQKLTNLSPLCHSMKLFIERILLLNPLLRSITQL